VLGRSSDFRRVFCATLMRRCLDTRADSTDPYRDLSLLAFRSVSTKHGLCEACEKSGVCRQLVDLDRPKHRSTNVDWTCPGAQFLVSAE